jgi:hypothetical protein
MTKIYDTDQQRHCTLPAIPWLRDWFEKKFGDLCQEHDHRYITRKCKFCSDWKLCLGMARRGYPVLALLTYVLLNTVGWAYWFTKE